MAAEMEDCVKPTFSQLTDQEQAWVASQLELAAKIINAFAPKDAGKPLTLAALDRAFAAWVDTKATDSELVNGVVNGVGVAFGQSLVDKLGFAWVMASDADGTDLAVLGLPGKGDVLIYPANVVAKRWERRETNFLERVYEQVAEQVKALAAQDAMRPHPKPWWKLW